MSENPIHVHQCALIISLRCTLKCKLCLVYAPYYEAPKDYPTEQTLRSIEMYFKLIDTCGTFNIQGGEPLMHPNLSAILKKTAEYRERIGKILLTTNGTLLPSLQVLETLQECGTSVQVNISDYGPELSKKAPQLIKTLEEYRIPYHVINYHGNQIHFGGWLDFTDHTLKHQTEEELITNASECGYRSGGNLAIRNGELFFCYRVARRIELGIIEKNEKSCVDMFDARPIEEKRQNIRDILNAPYTPACAYCIGKRSDAKHYPPAEQLSREDMIAGIEKMDVREREKVGL